MRVLHVVADGPGTALRRGLLVALNGFVILGVEFAAQRQLAPRFGQSVHVWSAVIAVLLVALAIGYARGGRFGARATGDRALAPVQGGAALWLIAVAFAGPTVTGWMVPTGLPTPGGLPLGLVGSLLAGLALHALPVALLAMTTPFVVGRSGRQGTAARATGRFVALGTFGSLVACWAVPLEMLPRLGTRGTFLWLAGAACLNVLLAAAGRRSGGAAASPRPPAAAVGAAPDPRTTPRERLLARAPAWAAALLAGFAVTALELGGVRLMSPWVGQSNFVWAAVIGVCLLALALGSAVGGRLATTAHPRRVLALLLGLGGLLAAAPVFAVGPLLGALVPPELTSLVLLPVAFAGSAAGALALLAPAQFLLGAMLPLLVATRGPSEARAAVGGLLAANTVGGLLGCVLTAPLLVPWMGSRGVFLLMGVLLAGLGVALAVERRGRATLAVLVLLAAAGLHIAQGGPLRRQPGQRVEIETAYQTVRVVEAVMASVDPATGAPAAWKADTQVPTRFLRHDEDAETYQSVLLLEQRDTLLTGGRYFESMALGAHLVDAGEDGTVDILLIGHAGGTVWRTLRATAPPGVALRCLAVEIDPGVVDVARAWLAHGELEDDRLHLVTGEDGRTVVNALPKDRRFDLVLVDAYARTNYVPFQLATREFFERVRAHLAPGGWIGVNVLGYGTRSRVAAAIGATLHAAVGPTFLVPNAYFPGNVILWSAPDGGAGPRRSAGGALPAGLAEAGFALERLGVRVVPAAGDPVLTDDHSVTDRLADEEFGL